MGEIYGLYSTRDGQIRYVGQTEYTAYKSLDQIITKALERQTGALFKWIQDEWRDEHDVRARILQDDIIPADLEMFVTYWKEQFSGLLDEEVLRTNETSEIGMQINQAIIREIRGNVQ